MVQIFTNVLLLFLSSTGGAICLNSFFTVNSFTVNSQTLKYNFRVCLFRRIVSSKRRCLNFVFTFCYASITIGTTICD